MFVLPQANVGEERGSVEGTITQNGGVRRLVLGFDAGCMTCSELARRIEERVGDRLEVRSLNDPMMDHWRREAYGEDAPWAPTLVEIDGGPARAWTGVRMGARLSRALGPVATWRVMQALGEANSDLGLADSVPARAVSGLSRGQFLKGVGGAVVALSVLAGTGKLPSPADAAVSVDHEELTGAALAATARRVARQDRKSTRLNSSHANISYAVFCLKKKKQPYSFILAVHLYIHFATHLSTLSFICLFMLNIHIVSYPNSSANTPDLHSHP